MPWSIFIILFVAATTLPACWLGCNRLCVRLPARCTRLFSGHARVFVRVWLCTSFATVWLSIQPRQRIDATSPDWEWQLPLYAVIPVVLIFGDSDKAVTGCTMLLHVGIAAVGCFLAFLIIVVIWLSRGSQAAQGTVFSCIQPTVSAAVIVFQRRCRSSWVKSVQYSHLLQVLVTFQSFVYGTTSSASFTAWKLPVFAFVCYTVGLVFIFMCALFVAPRWTCGISEANEVGEGGGAAPAAKQPPLASQRSAVANDTGASTLVATQQSPRGVTTRTKPAPAKPTAPTAIDLNSSTFNPGAPSPTRRAPRIRSAPRIARR